jgi:hypothetical protein
LPGWPIAWVPTPNASRRCGDQKQLEYTWTRSLIQRYSDFWQVPEDALDFELEVFDRRDATLRSVLLDAR